MANVGRHRAQMRGNSKANRQHRLSDRGCEYNSDSEGHDAEDLSQSHSESALRHADARQLPRMSTAAIDGGSLQYLQVKDDSQQRSPHRPYASLQPQLTDRVIPEGPLSPSTSVFEVLPATAIRFCQIGLHDYDQCAKFAHRKLELWKSAELLPAVAKEFLKINRTDAARKVVSRYWMLQMSRRHAGDSGSYSPSMHLAHSRYLKRLAADREEQERFKVACSEVYTRLYAEFESHLSQESPTTGTQFEVMPSPMNRIGQIPQVSRPHTYKRHSVISRDSRDHTQTESSAGGSQSTVPLSMIGQDVDSGSIAGGKAISGPSGPMSDVIANWSDATRRELRREYKLHVGNEINDVFAPGCLIALLWHENLGNTLPAKYASFKNEVPKDGTWGPGYITMSRSHNEYIFSHVRRFVIVIQRRGHSIGIPITTYASRGISAKKLSDVERRAHAIIYASDKEPVRLPEEPPFLKNAICVNIQVPDETISPASRLYYAKPTSIDHNSRIRLIGRVATKHQRQLLTSFKNELFSGFE